MPIYSFVIPSYERLPLLIKCIRSIEGAYEYWGKSDYEIIVVFCAVNYDKRLFGAKYPSKIHCLYSVDNHVCMAKNIGIKTALGKYVVLVDDDATVRIDFFRQLECEAGTEVGNVFCARLRDPITNSCFTSEDETRRKGALKRIEFNLFRGSALVIDRRLLLNVGAYDETFGPGGRYFSGEESDLFFRILNSGHEAIYLPNVVIHHPVGNRINGDKAYRYAFATGALLTKHGLQRSKSCYVYWYLLIRKILICSFRLVQVILFSKRMKAKNERNQYFHALKGLIHGVIAYCRFGGSKN